MFVTVIHRIHDPKGFQEAEAKALAAGLPAGVALPVHAASRDHRLGICIWEGESVAAVREVVEGAVGLLVQATFMAWIYTLIQRPLLGPSPNHRDRNPADDRG